MDEKDVQKRFEIDPNLHRKGSKIEVWRSKIEVRRRSGMFWAALGRFWVPRRLPDASQTLPGLLLGSFWAPLEAPWGLLGASWRLLEGLLGASCDSLTCSKSNFGVISHVYYRSVYFWNGGTNFQHLKASWRLLRTSWELLWAS